MENHIFAGCSRLMKNDAPTMSSRAGRGICFRLSSTRNSRCFAALLGALLVAASVAWAASPITAQEDAGSVSSSSPIPPTTSQAPGSVVPHLIKFSGVVKDATGKLQTGAATLTFSLYQEQETGRPLWMETQSVQLDEQGQYTVLLGATQPEGLPLDLFATGQARWLGVQPALAGVGEQPRILLVGVPYALKAADADTLGGKPMSAFVTTDSQTTPAQAGTSAATGATVPSTSAKPVQSVGRDAAAGSANPSTASVAGTGTTNFIPRWTSSTALGNSLLFQTAVGSVGLGTTTPTQKLEVDSGNVLVKGPQNFKGKGNTAFLYVGDTSHPIEAIWNTGLVIGVYKVPEALFIQDQTGNVGIGTTTPKGAILSTAASSKSVIGFSTVGWNATTGSGLAGTDAIHATGGSVDPSTGSSGGGVGVSATGGYGGGTGVIATGGQGAGGSASGAGDGLVANGGNEDGAGITATGGSGGDGDGAGVIGTGGCAGLASICAPGVVAHGGMFGMGDGIDAMGTGGGFAGSFTGDVSISGSLNVAGTKNFRIDHPLDPANKYLYHAALESSEVLNLYTGNVVLDGNGEAGVQLPEWFEAVNRDFRYQLTAIGAPAPNLHIAQKIQNNSFRIAGGSAGLEVSWQVSGVRQDAWEKAHPMVVEVEKPPRERGFYLNPELFGAPPERNMDWARNPRLMKRMKDIQEKLAKNRQAILAKPVKPAKP